MASTTDPRIPVAQRRLLSLESRILLGVWLLTLAAMTFVAWRNHTSTPWQNITSLWLRDDHRYWGWAACVATINLVAATNARHRRELAAILAGAALILLITFIITRVGAGSATALYRAVVMTGLFGLLALVSQARHTGGIERLLLVFMFTTFFAIHVTALNDTYVIRPQTLDEYVYHFDAALGFDPAWRLFTLHQVHHLFAMFCDIIYDLIWVPTLALFAIQSRWVDVKTVPAIRLFVITSVIGYLCYIGYPVSGPLYFFGREAYAALPQDYLTPRVVNFQPSWRNAMPSLHFSLTMLMAINVPRQRHWVRRLFYLLSIVTVIAALAKGEHYVADMVAALPFICAMQWICILLDRPHDRAAILGSVRSILLFVGFLVAITNFPSLLSDPASAWSSVAILLAACAFDIRLMSMGQGRLALHARTGTVKAP